MSDTSVRNNRNFQINSVHHLITKGNNQDIFLDDRDFNRYIFSLRKFSKRLSVRILAFCLMPNHVHILARQDSEISLSKFMQTLSTAYANYFNTRYKRQGHLFEARFKNIEVTTDEYLIHLSRYIHLNPSSSQIVQSPQHYKWGSYKHYLGNGSLDFIDERIILAYFSKDNPRRDYQEFVESRIEYQKDISLQKLLLE